MVLSAWAVLLPGVVLATVWAPGILAHRDMLVLDHPSFTMSALGLSELPARATPQDAVLALVGRVLPASYFARALLVGAVGAATWGGWRIARHLNAPLPATMLAMLLATWPVPIVQRLAQGHWTLAITGWLLVPIVYCAMTGRHKLQWALMLPASLTPTGAAFTLLAAVLCTPRKRVLSGGYGLVLCSPWLLPGVARALGIGDGGGSAGAGTTGGVFGQAVGYGVRAFVPRAELTAPWLIEHHSLREVLTLLAGGGIWNAEVVGSQRGAAAWAGVVLAALVAWGLVRWLHARDFAGAVLLGAVGCGVAVLPTVAPAVFDVLVGLPGGGLARDANKFLLLCGPAGVVLAAHLCGKALAWVALCAAAGNLWGAPAQVGALRPVEWQPVAVAGPRAGGGLDPGEDVFLPGAETLVRLPAGSAAVGGRVLSGSEVADEGSGGVPVVNPWFKQVSAVEPGRLLVDGQATDAVNPRWQAADLAWANGDLRALGRMGVGAVVDPATGEVLARIGSGEAASIPVASPHPPRWVGYALLALWFGAYPAVLGVGAAGDRRRGRRGGS